MKIKYLIRFAAMATLFAQTAVPGQGKVTTANAIGDNMVLQQQTNVRLWGWAKPGSTVRIHGSWKNSKTSCQADSQGRWNAQITTPEASFEPQQLTLSDPDGKVVIHNILIGEVWIASGQSNMEMGLAGFVNRVIENAPQEILGANKYHGRLRLIKLAHEAAGADQDSLKRRPEWKECTAGNVPAWSAVAYYFAQTLTEQLDVPVGIVQTAWGGTTVESWMPRELLPEPKSDGEKKDFGVRYSGMIHPIEGFTTKGFIWYQGEANLHNHSQYAGRLSAMIKAWRERWHQGDLPFYQVEIAPYAYEGKDLDDKAAMLREAQARVAATVNNVGIVSTVDLVYPYERTQIHPCQKRAIGLRLALLALKRQYGMTGLNAECPKYKGMTVKNGRAIVKISHAETGFNLLDHITGFEVAGTDRKFYPAKASAGRGEIILQAPEVSQPVSVRYCFHNFMPGSLTNTYGLPLMPFRSDNW